MPGFPKAHTIIRNFKLRYLIIAVLVFLVAIETLYFHHFDFKPRIATDVEEQGPEENESTRTQWIKSDTIYGGVHSDEHQNREPEHVTHTPELRLDDSEESKNDRGDYLLVYDFLQSINASCRQDLINLVEQQETIRRKRERLFMDTCNWYNMTDKRWYNVIGNGKLIPGDVFKKADDSRAGSVLVQLDYKHQKRDAWFKVAPVREDKHGEKHISQIAVFILDRLLGLYYAVPSKGYNLNVAHLRSIDVPPNFKVFLSRLDDLVNEDGFTGGTVNAWIGHRLIKGDFQLDNFTAVPKKLPHLGHRNRHELEFRLLLWLTGLDLREHNTRVTYETEYPVLFDSDRAFRDQNTEKSIYLRNCRFPRHMVEYLKLTDSLSSECSLSQQVSSALQIDQLRPNAEDLVSRYRIHDTNEALKILDMCVEVMLELVRRCEGYFGSDRVLYTDY